MKAFRDTLIDCNLEDMGYEGDIFTWRRGLIRERLDRAVCDPRWSAMFPLAGVVHEDFGKSDHRPILIDTERLAGIQTQYSKAPLRFEARWLCESSIESIIQTAWDRAKLLHTGNSFREQTKEVHEALHEWDSTVLKGPRKRLRELQVELNLVMSGPLSDDALSKQRELQIQIENLLEQEEIYWVQRGRANWLRHGDQNTAFFHRFASGRRKRNFIKQLTNESGNIIDDQDQMMDIASGYFQHLFTSEVQDPDQGVIDKVLPCVTNEMNDILTAPYTREEVKKAMFNIGDLKAPGPDGLHAIFYKRFWHIIGEDLTDEVLLAVNSRVIPEGWNHTTIVLIPKVESPESITQFRPISLCNVVYKVIAKLLANRLKHILTDTITPNRSAFVPGRLITDNILVAYESYHTIKSKKTGKYGICAVKLDMHKAYDRVEWTFLQKILVRLGFDHSWVDLIMACVSSVRHEPHGGAVLEALLRDRSIAAPLLPEVDRNDLLAVGIWYIWWERRKAAHGEPVQNTARTAQSICALSLSYSRAKKKNADGIRHRWSKPKEDFVKLNVDAGFCEDSGTGSTGAILRDDRGAFLAASSSGIPFISDPASAEARALRDGLLLAAQIGCNRLEVVSDCLEMEASPPTTEFSNDLAKEIYRNCRESIVFVMFETKDTKLLESTLVRLNPKIKEEEKRRRCEQVRYATGFVVEEKEESIQIVTCAHPLDHVYTASAVSPVQSLNDMFMITVLCDHQELTFRENKRLGRDLTTAKITRIQCKEDMILLTVYKKQLLNFQDATCLSQHRPLAPSRYNIPALEGVVMVSWPPSMHRATAVGQISHGRRDYDDVFDKNKHGYKLKLLEVNITGIEEAAGAPLLDSQGGYVGMFHGKDKKKELSYFIAYPEIQSFISSSAPSVSILQNKEIAEPKSLSVSPVSIPQDKATAEPKSKYAKKRKGFELKQKASNANFEDKSKHRWI
ncbi:hypothetical protein QYE76_065861 [Lolium multiflorum]|uniref:Reverse transcriptase domain-containing protein n=1 Tax=Lolium multiflorum TaxID=4521 RepID=A0AAD8SAW9_LOLMU|nr:hypothetical protein QYE76_065861 [Lolium multiflorum]